MQSRRSISLFSVLLLFTQLASALPNPAARGLAARVAEPAAVDVEARGWNYGDNSDDDHRLDNNGDHKWDNNNGNRLDKWDNNDDHKWDNNNGNRLDKWDNNDDHKWDNNNGNRLDKWDNNDDHKWDNNNGNRLDKWDNNDDHKWDNNGNRLDKSDNNDSHGKSKWDQGKNEWDHTNDNVWDLLGQAQLDISAEINIIKSYQDLSHDRFNNHVTRIRTVIEYIHESISVKYQAGHPSDDIFGNHSFEEIHVQIVLIVNSFTDLLGFLYGLGISAYISFLVDLCNDISNWLQLSTKVVGGLSASLSVSVSTFVKLSSGVGVPIPLN